MDKITSDNIVGTRWRATKSSEGHEAGDVVRVTKFKPMVGRDYHGLPNGFVNLKNERTQRVSSHGACVLGEGFLAAEPLVEPRTVEPATKDQFVLRYRVTEGDIKSGVVQDCSMCPHARGIAAAIKRRFRRWGKHTPGACTGHVFGRKIPSLEAGEFYVEVEPWYIAITVKRSEFVVQRFEAKNSAVIHEFIRDFDHGQQVSPGEFELVFKAA